MDTSGTQTTTAPTRSKPTVVFIHGVNGSKKLRKWLVPLNDSLRDAGIEAIDHAEVPDVRYRRYLARKPDKKTRRMRRGSTDAAAKAGYALNQDELRRALRKFRKSSTSHLAKVPDPIRKHGSWIIRKSRWFKDAERYRRRRERVCAEVLKMMGPGEFIVIGHSLGSVVAADLLARLDKDQHVRLLVTVGSPLGAGDWSRTWRSLDPFPFGELDAWVNIYNPYDWVTGGVGLGKRTKRVIDIPIKPFAKSPWSVTAQHKIGPYVSHPAVATAIRWAVRADIRPPR